MINKQEKEELRRKVKKHKFEYSLFEKVMIGLPLLFPLAIIFLMASILFLFST